ncbi:MAG: hypothetical protein ACHQ49_11495 [Elusimicrobiota bacterium]
MEAQPPSRPGAVGTFFNVLERLVMFALSLAVGLLNLLIALVVAAHLGVVPKAAADRVLGFTSRATASVVKFMGPPAPQRKSKR